MRRAARAGRAGQRKEHSSPCAGRPRRALAIPGPTLAAPSSSAECSWQGAAACWHRWAVALGKPGFPCLSSGRGAGLHGYWGPLTWGLGTPEVSCHNPADRQQLCRTSGLLWLRVGNLSCRSSRTGVLAQRAAGGGGCTAGGCTLPAGPRAQLGPVNQASCMVMGGVATLLNSAELRPARRPSPASPGQSWRTMPGDSSSLRALCPPGLGSRPAKAFVPTPSD